MNRSRRLLHVAPLLLLAAPILLGARGCGGDDVPIGGCDESACGPAPGAPAITCADGSIGGNTGRCLADADGTCGWEFRDCPPPPDDCTDVECGPEPLSPHPTRCERDADGACRWIRDDPGACESAECGPAPGIPSWTCADGTVGGFTGRCERDPATGACGWEINDCPLSGECSVDACGPAPGAPACTCADGSIGCNTGRCLRGADGACGWEWRECPDPTSCGGLTPDGTPTCGDGYTCVYAPEDICGAADAPGTCTRRPSAAECDAIDGGPADRTVCGCDGATYASECHAWAAGTSAARAGACSAADCDTSDVSCEIVEPTCPPGETPTQVGLCYGPCVPISSCAPIACSADGACPSAFTCDPSTGTCVAR